jgi:MFS family permease
VSVARRRWLALYVLCLGSLMIVLDTTIVGVALPSIRTDLGFSEASLAWVVNAYLPTFGSCCWAAGWAICLGIDGSSSAASRSSRSLQWDAG